MVLVLVAVLLLVAIVFPAVEGLRYGVAKSSASLVTQSVLLLGVTAIAGVGVVFSAFARVCFVEFRIVRNAAVCAALALPGVDIFAHLTSDLGLAVGGHMLTSFVVGGAIAIAISSAWMEWFWRK